MGGKIFQIEEVAHVTPPSQKRLMCVRRKTDLNGCREVRKGESLERWAGGRGSE